MTTFFDALTGRRLQEPPADAWRLDDGKARSYVVGPAFFDPQVNGYAGVDFQHPDLTLEQFEGAIREMQRDGCAHFLPTLITAAPEQIEDQFRRLADFMQRSELVRGAIPGFHLEGPFISAEPGYIGAHPSEHACAPDAKLFERWQKASGGKIKILTLAPEWPGSAAAIRKIVAGGVLVAIGHSNASYADLMAAVEAGARMVTHLSNGAPAQMHRHDNIIQRVLGIPELMISLIPDGWHVPAPVMGNIVRAAGPARVILTTDAAAPAAAPLFVPYKLGRLTVVVTEDRVVRMEGSENLAGSALTPSEGFYNAVRFGAMSVDMAWNAWTRIRRIVAPGIATPQLMLPFPAAPLYDRD